MKILVVPTDKYVAAMKERKFTLSKFLNKEGLYIERDDAETDPTYLQIIPYIIVKDRRKIFLYSRLNKGNEARLHGKLSAGVGGHTDYVDPNISCYDTLVHNSHKELAEELNISLSTQILEIEDCNKTIYDPSNDVGKVHLGVLYTVDVSGREVSVRETDKIEGKFYSPREIKELYDERGEDAFETWTNIALETVLPL